jgi:hypothetical protein
MPARSTGAPAAATLATMSAAGTQEHNGSQTLAHGLERYRTLRRELESAILPLATSLDGRRFTFQASLHGLELRVGGYVTLDDEEDDRDGDRMGHVLSLEAVEVDADPAEEARLSFDVEHAQPPEPGLRHTPDEVALADSGAAPHRHNQTLLPGPPAERIHLRFRHPAFTPVLLVSVPTVEAAGTLARPEAQCNRVPTMQHADVLILNSLGSRRGIVLHDTTGRVALPETPTTATGRR